MPQASTSLARIKGAILVVRGQRVLLDADLAALYGVETRALNQAVGRNRQRFPEDFMIRLTAEEAASLRSQIVILEGVAMLSSVLRSPRAIAVNIEIMRAFVEMRRVLDSTERLARKLDSLERNNTASSPLCSGYRSGS